VLRQRRVVAAHPLDELAGARRVAGGHDDVVVRALLGAGAAQANLQHFQSLSSGLHFLGGKPGRPGRPPGSCGPPAPGRPGSDGVWFGSGAAILPPPMAFSRAMSAPPMPGMPPIMAAIFCRFLPPPLDSDLTVSAICRCCLSRRLTSCTSTPAPAAIRRLREAFRRSGFLRSALVIEEMIASWRAIILS